MVLDFCSFQTVVIFLTENEKSLAIATGYGTFYKLQRNVWAKRKLSDSVGHVEPTCSNNFFTIEQLSYSVHNEENQAPVSGLVLNRVYNPKRLLRTVGKCNMVSSKIDHLGAYNILTECDRTLEIESNQTHCRMKEDQIQVELQDSDIRKVDFHHRTTEALGS